MSEPVYIWIPNWHGPDGFQHYRDRDPIWIKNYTRLLSHDQYAPLSLACRGLLHGIWLEYARSAQKLPGDTLTLSRRIGQKVTKKQVDALVEAGLIELVASSVLAARYQDASDPLALARVKAETETETETEEPVPVPVPEANYDDDIQFDRNGTGTDTGFDIPADLLREMPT